MAQVKSCQRYDARLGQPCNLPTPQASPSPPTLLRCDSGYESTGAHGATGLPQKENSPGHVSSKPRPPL
ncbi:hypothetical protein E2C01_004025 [Portunus trituberculatus]|uniref:Uncharacterized protein n=1 Tax=Portunus trituberculatus TaxID=210409 RepID=A0A5B7CV93_PORTR|nr:hypothetical protein [Portunus trituberculatus]